MQSTFRRDDHDDSCHQFPRTAQPSCEGPGQDALRLPMCPRHDYCQLGARRPSSFVATGSSSKRTRAGGLLRPPRIRSAASVHVRLSASIPAFTWAPVRGNSVALRRSVFCFTSCPAGSGSSPKKFAQTAKNAERISFGSLRKSRPSALGSRAHSRGFARCAPSKYGSSKRRTRHVSEQNYAHRFPRK